MFSKDIVCTRMFLEMPPSARALYYQLGIEADDDGFIDPYITMLATKSQEDDLKILIAKGFVINFESKIIVIRHWNQHNYIRKDTYNETQYKDEKRLLSKGENQEYLLPLNTRQRTVNVPSTQDRIGKDRIGKDRVERENTPTKKITFNSRKDITDSVLQELADKYGVPKDFAVDCWDSAVNWLDSKGQNKKDYRAFLSNWIKREKASYLINNRKGIYNGKRAVDISNLN